MARSISKRIASKVSDLIHGAQVEVYQYESLKKVYKECDIDDLPIFQRLHSHGLLKSIANVKGDHYEPTLSENGSLPIHFKLQKIGRLATEGRIEFDSEPKKKIAKWLLSEEERMLSKGYGQNKEVKRCERAIYLQSTFKLFFLTDFDPMGELPDPEGDKHCTLILEHDKKTYYDCKTHFLRIYPFKLTNPTNFRFTLTILNDWYLEIKNHRKVSTAHHPNIADIRKAALLLKNDMTGAIVFEQEVAPGNSLFDWTVERRMIRYSEVNQNYAPTADLIPEDQAARIRLDILIEAFKGLHYIHTQPNYIMHGDMTPSNIMVKLSKSTEGAFKLDSLKIIDFGKARDTTVEAESHLPPDTSPLFRAPDWEIRSHTLGTSYDIFSMGLTAFRLYCGKHEEERLTGALREDQIEDTVNLQIKNEQFENPNLDVVARRKELVADYGRFPLKVHFKDVKEGNKELKEVIEKWPHHLVAVKNELCKQMPDEIFLLIQKCVSIDPTKRPTAGKVVEDLMKLKQSAKTHQ